MALSLYLSLAYDSISQQNTVMRIERGNTFIAFMTGIFLPCAGFYLLKWLFQAAEVSGLIDVADYAFNGSRVRTITIIAICMNLIPLQIYQRRREGQSIRGIAVATVLMAGIWFYWFFDSLYPA